VTIEQVELAPTWFDACTPGCGYVKTELPDPPDVALIRIREETPIPEAIVDLRPISAGEPVVIMGYGCESDEDPAPPGRLKYQTTQAIPSDEFGDLGEVYFFTAGPEVDPAGAAICPGDSGGPVFRDDGTQQKVIGINSQMLGLERNYHTRLDNEARVNVAAWLRALGVNTLGPVGLGDVNADGAVTVVDALMVAQVASQLTVHPFFPDVADVNCDGVVSPVDALQINHYFVGLISEFPCQRAFQESSGRVVVEAENYDTKVPQGAPEFFPLRQVECGGVAPRTAKKSRKRGAGTATCRLEPHTFSGHPGQQL
jgi:hypothetical protein